MIFTVEKVKDTFLFLNVEPIVCQPTYNSIRALQKKLNANAASVVSHIRNGCLGLLYLTVISEVYLTLSDQKFEPPKNPGHTADVPENGTQYQIQAAEKLNQ